MRADLFTQLAALETAGLAPEKAFGMLRLDKALAPRIELARKLIARGQNPAMAGEKSALFDKLEARIVRAALAAGSPALTYRRFGERYTRRAMQINTVKAKMWLPGFMLVLGLFIGPLPGLVTGSLSAGAYLGQVLWPLIVIGALVQMCLRLPRWLRDSALEEPVDAFLPQIPLFGPMVVRRNARDFFENLALMLEAGIPMLEALPAATDTIANIRMRQEYETLISVMETGATFAQALHMLRQVGDARVLAFAQTGEASGTLPEMLLRHADMESASLAEFYTQIATWAPRIVYGLVALWMIKGLMGQSLMIKMPPGV